MRRLQILSSRLVNSRFAGEYRSVFRGRGIEFEEVREYQPGDDIRNIDWNVTARTGRPFVKLFIEEREMTVMLVLDRSASLQCASAHGSKARLGAEVCALLAFAAARSHDRVGLLTFSDRIEQYIPPAKGVRHVRRLVAEIRKPPETANASTDLAGALHFLERVQRRGCILFLVSDFVTTGYQPALTIASRRNDVVAVALSDPIDFELPDVGLIRMRDAETGYRRLVDSSSVAVQQGYREHAVAQRAALRSRLASAGADLVEIGTECSPARTLMHFFLERQQRLNR